MIKGRLFRDVSFNVLQTFVAQATGIITFYITSKYLIKEEYGELNWILAVGTTLTTIACLGLDMTVIKKISENRFAARKIFQLHFFHTIVSSIILLAAAVVFLMGNSSFSKEHPFFLLVFLAALIIYICNSYKLSLSGLRSFKKVAAISITGNLVKAAGIIVLYLGGWLSVQSVAYIWLVSAVAELIAGIVAGAWKAGLGVRPRLHKALYKGMIIMSLPVFLAVVFDAVLAKIDWVLMGVLSTSVHTAEYIFAYKIFELSKLPLIIIAPLFLPYLTRLFIAPHIEPEKNEKFRNLLKVMMFISVLIPLVLNVCWVALFDPLTDGKYGQSSYPVFLVLSLCIPLHYVTNFYYSKTYALGRFRVIMWVTFAVSLLNLGINCLLIPKYGGLGAAWAFLIATVFQVILYMLSISQQKLEIKKRWFLLSPLAGALSFYLSTWMDSLSVSLLVALSAYLVISWLTGFINVGYWLKQIGR